MKKKRKVYLYLIVILGLTIGFALLSTTLKINGNASIKSNTWDIHWENVKPNSESTITTETPGISENATKVTYEVELELPGDFYEFTVDAKNDGSINGEILDIRHNVYQVVNGEVSTEETTLPSYIKYSIVYDGTENAPTVGDLLEAGEKQIYRIRIEYDSKATILPSSDLTYKIIDEIDYGQTKKNSRNNYTTETASIKCENGTMLGENWCYTNPGSSLENQEFQYYLDDTTYIKTGWATVDDLYDSKQIYYFENGIAKKGWRTENGKRYYLSTFDSDGNGYVNCNLIVNAKMMIDNVCYNFDAKGVATESTGCESYTYYYYDDTTYETTSTVEPTNRRAYFKKLPSSDTISACVDFNNNGNYYCVDSIWDCPGGGDTCTQDSYIMRVKNYVESTYNNVTCNFIADDPWLECESSDYISFYIRNDYYDNENHIQMHFVDGTVGCEKRTNDESYFYCVE